MTKKHQLRISGKYAFQQYEVDADFRYMSLGVGVQSSCMLLMVLEGQFDPAPECAIFSDTGWEPPYVYEYLTFLQEKCRAADFPLYVVSAGNLRDDVLNNARNDQRWAAMPLFVNSPTRGTARLRRQCTREYKLEPIQQKVRDLLGYHKGRHLKHTIEAWQGISYDEMQRMRENRHKAYWNRYPLIERRLTRLDCAAWIKERGYPEPAKSACIGCPYHDDRYWRNLQTNYPAAWQDAVDFDRQIREGHVRLRGVESEAFLHRSLVPLDQVRVWDETDQLDLFAEECEGMCGV